AHAALLPGGQLIVADVFTGAGGDGPPFACLFGLNMLLSAEGGGVHPAPAMAQWMVDAGFTAVATHPLPPPMPHTALVGVRG
ncbi:MAG: methyltransferase, partial [Nitrospirae bacterium CG06_land_8_20_14_3_00_70_43]